MCTAVYLKNQGLFGRTLDLEYTFGETVTVTPEGYAFDLRADAPFTSEFAIIGMAHVRDDYPLYYDAVNEKGLAMAGLNFPRSACYKDPLKGYLNLAPYELIPYILGTCKNLGDAKEKLSKLNLVNIPFSDDLPLTPLHFMIADREGAVVLEQTKDGPQLYDNPIGVMTNEPPFPYLKTYLENFKGLSSFEDNSRYSRGLSAFGLPGDFSSSSRFVRGAFLIKHFVSENAKPTEFFRICESVSVPSGAIRLQDGKSVITKYTSCMDLKEGIYYYRTYSNSRICRVSLKNSDGEKLLCYPLRVKEDILFE